MKNTSICNWKIGNITTQILGSARLCLHYTHIILLLIFKYLKVQYKPKIAQTLWQCFSNKYHIRAPLRNFHKRPSVTCFAFIYTKQNQRGPNSSHPGNLVTIHWEISSLLVRRVRLIFRLPLKSHCCSGYEIPLKNIL